MADAPRSGRGEITLIGVQVPASACLSLSDCIAAFNVA